MPFKSEAQRRFMYAKHPEIAKEFEAHTPKGKKLPKHVSMIRDHAKSAALSDYGLEKIALPGLPVPGAGMMGGLRTAGNFLNKIPGVGAISGGIMGAVQGYQQGGFKRALGSGILGAGTGVLGLAGMPLQMAGEKVMDGMQHGPQTRF